MKAFTVMLKDLRLIARDRSALVFMLVVPIVVILVVAEAQSGAGTRSIVFPVVNEDQGPVANALIKVFRKHLDVREMSRPAAERLVAVENQAPAALLLPRGMSKRYLTDKPSTIELFTDPAQWEELQAIKVIMLLADRDAATLGDPFGGELLSVKEHNITGGKLKFSSLEQNVPGFSLMFVLLTVVFSVSLGLREEEAWGTAGRLSIAPVSGLAVLAGKLLARLIIGIAQLLVLLLFAHFVFGLSLGQAPFALLLVAVSVVFSMASFAVIVAALARTREQAIPVGMSVVFLLAAPGGLWWPFFDQPKWMQTIGQGAMTTWSMFAIQDVILRDKSLAEVSAKLAILLVYGLVSFIIGLSLFRHRDGRRA
jgi:ABC-2 type transport system permease protein